jgi:hypothetical protein
MTRLAETEPGKYERAAARWHVRFFPEVPNVDILENQACSPFSQRSLPTGSYPPE